MVRKSHLVTPAKKTAIWWAGAGTDQDVVGPYP
jgi:hypothetical protein